MCAVFYGTAAFNQDLGGWDVSSVANMENSKCPDPLLFFDLDRPDPLLFFDLDVIHLLRKLLLFSLWIWLGRG